MMMARKNRDWRIQRERQHPLSVGRGGPLKSTTAREAARHAEEDERNGHNGFFGWLRKNLLGVLVADPDLEVESFVNWLRTLRDRRFYFSSRGISFGIIDDYFHDHGFHLTEGMTLKPSRRVVSRLRETSGLLHPREHIYSVAPGDPLFQANSSVSSSAGGIASPLAGSSNSNYVHDSPSTGKFFDLPAPQLIITSQRVIVREETPRGQMWVSHFYNEMVNEAPAILSWIDETGWHRALDNQEDHYYNSVRYYDSTGQRLTINCPNSNTSSLVSWIVQNVCERNARRMWRTRRTSPSARAYSQRDIQMEHLAVPEMLAEAKYLVDLAKDYEVRRTPPPEREEEKKKEKAA